MAKVDLDYTLDDKYLLDEGNVFLSGTQALVKLPLIQKKIDEHNGINTAGFISGYPGSPLVVTIMHCIKPLTSSKK